MIGWLLNPRDPRHRLGVWGEGQAARHLRRQGFRILARNWTSDTGEIDLIAEKAGTVHFIEVKTRSSDVFGAPEEAVAQDKRQRIRRAARDFLGQYRRPPEGMSFDVVSVGVVADRREAEIQWSPGAF